MPDYVQPTIELLSRAFPTGLRTAEYFAVLAELAPHMSQRNLAEVMAVFLSGSSGLIYNDILGVDNRTIDPALVDDIRHKLSEAGFDHWLRET